LIRALQERNLLSEALASKEAFLDVVGYKVIGSTNEDTSTQQRLL